MKSETVIEANPARVVAERDPKIFGHFIEHFHRQIYGGVYDPGNTNADAEGFRTDVIDALRRIGTPVVRWPGGCFVSAYHWKDGVGPQRRPAFDKAWRVEEPNDFGTDEFIRLCRKIGAEPYICTNAGTGTPEEMSDWVEYCNLDSQGYWSRVRTANGYRQPHAVRYWSIGNENYLPGEMGVKTADVWPDFVRESAKMMKRVDPTIELSAAATDDLDWNLGLLRRSGDLLDWISVHGYWDMLHKVNNVSSYETCMEHSRNIEPRLAKIRHILGALGELDDSGDGDRGAARPGATRRSGTGKIRVAFDEWNLRGWHHPAVDTGLTPEEYLAPRDDNDDNSVYTMADAVFSACFLNACLRNADIVGMANFAPVVNTRGAIFTHPEGIVLRSTFHVFEMYWSMTGDTVIDSWVSGEAGGKRESAAGRDGDAGGQLEDTAAPGGEAARDGEAGGAGAAGLHGEPGSQLDSVATRGADGVVSFAVANRARAERAEVNLSVYGTAVASAEGRTLSGPGADSYNSIEHPDEVAPERLPCTLDGNGGVRVALPPHSVSVIRAFPAES